MLPPFKSLFGKEEISNYNNELASADGENCHISRVLESRCKVEEVEPGKFVRRCENIEKLFRHCNGRPAENVDTRVEYTEDDVTNNNADSWNHSFPQLKQNPPFQDEFNDIQSSLNSFFRQAEEMRDQLFGAFEMFFDGSYRGRESSHPNLKDDPFLKPKSSQQDAYAEYRKDFQDI